MGFGGVVDQHVDPAPARDHGSGEFMNGGVVADIARHAQGSDAERCQCRRSVFEFCAAEIRQRDAIAALRHFGRGCEADAARGPGDDRHRQVLCHDGQTLLIPDQDLTGQGAVASGDPLQLVLRVW
jgi:hypothetical protein